MIAPSASLSPIGQISAAAEPALELVRVSHAFGSAVVVEDVSLSVGQGEILCLVGPSGCGKSTLLRIAAGLEELQHGVVRIAGQVAARRGAALPPEKRGVGLVFQDYALFPHLTVLDNVRFGLTGRDGAAQRRRALEVLEQVGMADYAGVHPHMLSGGQQQRVALARALAPAPRVVLLDEPFSGLDAKLRGQVRDETLHVLKRSGTATLIVTHDPEEAMFLADRIALMRAGRLVQVGPPVALYCRPADAFAAGFFGEVNRLSARVEAGGVATPVGRVPAPDFADGAIVEVLIRPEALTLAADPPAAAPIRARVDAARLLGRTSLIHLAVPDGRDGMVHMHARMPGVFLPNEESFVSVLLDPRQAFVFPATGAMYRGETG